MNEQEIDRLFYYQKLLAEIAKNERQSFYLLVIEKGLKEEEVLEIFQLCKELQQTLEEQRELGFVHFTHLLVQFAGMLPHQLNVEEAIEALHEQGIFSELMAVLGKSSKKIREEYDK